MTYDEDFLSSFCESIEVLDVSLSELSNSLEKYVTQKDYQFSIDSPYSKETTYIKIRFLNTHIPHLLGLSKEHHFGLPIYRPEAIFDKLKYSEDWTLKQLRAGDERWFVECKDKVIGCFYLYQMMNSLETKSYDSNTNHFRGPKNHKILKRIERDKVSYIMIKNVEGITYSLEFSEYSNEPGIFFPRSLKINDPVEDHLVPITLTPIDVVRIKKQKRALNEKKRK